MPQPLPARSELLDRIAVIKVIAALFILNALAGFNNVWPTPLIQPDSRLGPEFVWLWVLLLFIHLAFGRIGTRALAVLSGLYFLVVIGRYADVTVPALFGRPLNLYWDGHQIPKFLEVASQALAPWQLLGLAAAILALLWGLYRLIRLLIGVLARHAVPFAKHSPAAWTITALSVALVVANLFQVQATWPYVSRPVIPVYWKQANLLHTVFSPDRLANVLPPSPPLDGNLATLDGAEVKVLFLESYGVTTYLKPEISRVINPARQKFQQAIDAAGQRVVSGLITAATFGGASELSHLSFLSGVDLTNPLRHDLMLTTERDTMIDTFRRAGYRTIGLYPAMSWAWPEKKFYNFDHYHDAPSLNYQGPKFGLWWLPDQFVMARIDELYPPSETSKPRFILYPTITSHIPFRPTPPYQPDWSRVTTDNPYDEAQTAAAMADKIDWTDLLPGYISTIEYTFKWLSGYMGLEQPRKSVLVLVGDHQPASTVTGPNASWDVPVHIVTDNPVVLRQLLDNGFKTGMTPDSKSLGGLDELNQILLTAFSTMETTAAPVQAKSN
ncbi:MAG: sulfatase-like hydrolase/transferase [Burkholderiaceae bacterium]